MSLRSVCSYAVVSVVTQCLLLPTGTHHSDTTHVVEREIVAIVTQSDLSRSHVSGRGGGGGGGGGACGHSE